MSQTGKSRRAHDAPVGVPSYRVGFHLVPGFPMMAFAAAIEPLRAANRLSGKTLYAWKLCSRDGRPVRASNGIDVAVHGPVTDAMAVDMAQVCAGTYSPDDRDAALSRWLRALARAGSAVGGISLGPYALADAGLLDHKRVAVHWESLVAFAERYPRARVTTDIFAIDGQRYTCAGGTAALDMMLQVIGEQHGRALAIGVSEQFIHSRIRDRHDSQRMAVQSRLGVANDRLIAAIDMMEAGADEALPVQEIASAVGLSPRQLERLFARYLRVSPSRHYMNIRLERARAMLLQTTRPILDVAVASGFTSASHFSRCYRETYGCKPSDERSGGSPTASERTRAGRA